ACGGGGGGGNYDDPLEPAPDPTINPTPTPNNPPDNPPNTPSGDPAFATFEQSFHPLLVNNCSGCHGDPGISTKFAISDAAAAYQNIEDRGLINLSTPTN